MPTLTTKFIEAVKPTDKRQEIPDGDARGLYLIIQPRPSGAMSFAWRYRHKGRSRKLHIGDAAMGLAEARKRARAHRVTLAKGTDPGIGDVTTVGAVIDAFIKQHVDVETKPSTAREYRRQLRKESQKLAPTPHRRHRTARDQRAARLHRRPACANAGPPCVRDDAQDVRVGRRSGVARNQPMHRRRCAGQGEAARAGAQRRRVEAAAHRGGQDRRRRVRQGAAPHRPAARRSRGHDVGRDFAGPEAVVALGRADEERASSHDPARARSRGAPGPATRRLRLPVAERRAGSRLRSDQAAARPRHRRERRTSAVLGLSRPSPNVRQRHGPDWRRASRHRAMSQSHVGDFRRHRLHLPG